MDHSHVWEVSLLGIVLVSYVTLLVVALVNRVKRPQQATRSGIMAECERCSVDLMRSVMPDLPVQDYRFRGMRLKMSSIHVGFENVGVKLKSKGKCILEGVTGEFIPKTMAAVMGPSGAGKTTFMNAICGRAYYGTVTGEVLINGQKSSIAEIKQLRGFVPQDDIVHEHLTVREQLYYSARLRNSEDASPQAIELIVEDVLNVMHLLDVQHSLVGNVERRGISGGQRKRVNIGLELASRPTILMLDEPTSGLDATTALDIIRSLKQLTAIGMTVVMVVHQPRYSLFTLFDEVLLLGLGGRTVYQGPSQGVLPYFRNLGFHMPRHENPADWFMDVIAGKVKNEDPSLRCTGLADSWLSARQASGELGGATGQNRRDDKLTFLAAFDEKMDALGLGGLDSLNDAQFLAFVHSSEAKNLSDGALAELKQRLGFQDGQIARKNLVNFLLGMQGSFSHDALSGILVSEGLGSSEGSFSTGLSSPTSSIFGKQARFCFQYPVLVHQNAIRWVRSWRHKVLSTFLVTVAAVVFGAQCREKLTPENILCPLKINLSHLALGLMVGIACLPIFGADRPTFWRESASGVRVSAFFLARCTVFMFDVLMWCYLFTGVWMLAADAPCDYWMWLIAFRMTAVSSAGIGVLLSTMIPEHTSTLATAVTILILGGGISEPQSVAEAVGTYKEVAAFLSPFTWAIGENYLAVIDQLGGEDAVNFFAVDIVEGYKTILESVGGGHIDYVTNSYISCSVFGVLAVLAGYIGLRWSHRGKQA
ncbi:unnamed protein product [Effrenium voratum]|uniref:ABC transporter domain-containing protein n=1 Tax=Effrenium voratum TaxID=2562239 RepID=A0AA36IKN5_9DINO|nr:unnamed protein product [Effrenium voratum]CAJ1389375.1 unnamed protein product [Effrenium voratum]CAJ1426301.1 unnamed protein product [Effrenium voratum]|mmetsp:Transcript_9625/g.22869  ORF Transcript_9625/g.22869 Transcript_9625/m.22869 type:complete len:763 (+) Transcript_9625:31-2319(+)